MDISPCLLLFLFQPPFSAISIKMLELDYGRMESSLLDVEWNAFGIKRIRHGDITFPPSTPKPIRIELPQKAKAVPRYPEKLLKSIGKVSVYQSRIEKTIDIQIVQIKKIKRIGGQYPYGLRNGTIVELREPIFVVRRTVKEPSYRVEAAPIVSNSNTITWLLGANSTEQDVLPYRLMSSTVRCRYCFAYWARQQSQKPTNLLTACCSS